MKMVNQKVKAGKSTEISQDLKEVEENEEVSSKNVLDLMPLLKKSLLRKKSSKKVKSKKAAHGD